ncbi:hypothetical protein BU24DRAFT_200978 [Aaosphaeria arxii CBS 175.79]|uniref:Uncharacterized protein n=1 Tax=Aaosphaeria arxii CBS 175.79 TaxID=1450172 RepID=A0A6A5XSV9_9PLEO|nr:uncharacterized protein BU24DRAFT_200978 [Aaosphaeria arxii CBS 175.79]KAF2016405.1 hypothetical protein BU24DRAFT_200978 [Aaosphaeria arxii CBS 175.79]
MLLTASTSHACYKPEDISSSALTLVSSSLSFWQDEHNLAKEEDRMAHNHQFTRPQSTGRPSENELWFSMPSEARSVRERSRSRSRSPEPTAFQATASRNSAYRSAAPGQYSSVPSISTTEDGLNKPLPPSPESEKKKRKPSALRNLIRRHPSDHLSDSSHLQPLPYQHQRSSSATGHLSPEPLYQPVYQSRSMPNSPAAFSQDPPTPVSFARAHSAAADYSTPSLYVPFSPQQQQQQPRAVSMSTYFEPQPPQSRRTFPETGSPSVTSPRDSYSTRPRPHTWLSTRDQNEPFNDDTDFHLFVEATSGFQDGSTDDNSTTSPQIRESLFGRGRQNDRIPIPFQHSIASAAREPVTRPEYTEFEPVHVSSSALPRPDSYYSPLPSPGINVINMELERLGISDDGEPDEELPNYAQSQAEMASKRRKEATERARELEARWNRSRSWRSR